MAAPDLLVATVAGLRIPLARLEQRIANLRRGPRGRHLPPDDGSGRRDLERWVVQELVTEEVLVHELWAAGIAELGIAAQDERSVGPRPSPRAVARLVERVTGHMTVTDDDVRDYYHRNTDLYRRPEARGARHVSLSDETKAMQAAASLAAGEDIGAYLEIRRGELAGRLEDDLFRASVGDVVGPIPSELGWHVARLECVVGASVVPYEEARPAIEAELLSAARRQAFDEWLEGRRQALAVIEPDFEHPAHPIHGIPSHRH